MNEPLISRKALSLIRCLKRIEEKRPGNLEELRHSLDLQDIISVNLERAIQISVDITAIIIAGKNLGSGNTMAEGFRVLEDAGILSSELSYKMQKSVAFRNISVHEYQEIDWGIVFDVIHHHLENFKDFLKAIEDCW
jgi:uncharacterized protein YutE (UPF0331/DUF86 family)